MKKLALIIKDEVSFWKSCQSITKNLILAYKALSNCETEIFQLSSKASMTEASDLATQMLDFDRVIWLDHYPHPKNFVKALKKLNLSKKPDLVFHLFGDFSLMSQEWLEIEEDLKSFNVNFVCASEKQKKLVLQFCENVSMCPFPVDAEVFSYSDEKEKKGRIEYSLEDDKFYFLYTGRLSGQKNIKELIIAFKEVRKFHPKCELLLCGEIDDLGTPFIGKYGISGMYFNEIKSYLNSDGVHYLGNLSSDQLSNLYHGTDAYISLSTHNDEDYGMAPAEAICCGLPAILTNWGGYFNFIENLGSNGFPVPVSFDDSQVRPSVSMAVKQMLRMISHKKDKKEISKKALGDFGLDRVKNILEDLHNSSLDPFLGFYALFHKFSGAFSLRPRSPFRDSNGNYDELYREVYEVYRQTKEEK